MKLKYANDKLKQQCTNLEAAKKLFSGDAVLGRSLLARVNALKQAETIKDIIVQPSFHFHNLRNKKGRNLEGYFAIDVKSRREQWRIILQPLDEDEKTYDTCNIDQVAATTKIVGIMEVSKHYE